MQAACRHFLSAANKGVIVNTASLAGKVGAPLLAHYSASKFAVLGWTRRSARADATSGFASKRKTAMVRNSGRRRKIFVFIVQFPSIEGWTPPAPISGAK